MTKAMKNNAGARLARPLASYADAKRFFDESARGQRMPKLAHNTHVVPTSDGGYAVRLHHTNIVTFYPDGTIALNSGGYQTVTTKARMNEVLRTVGVKVDQVRGTWYVRDFGTQQKVEFFDGMRFRVDAPASWGGDKWNTSVKLNSPYRGKFEGSGELGEKIHELIGDSSFLDEELGDVQGFGWFGLLVNTRVPGHRGAVHAIVSEDNQGFFDVTVYPSAAAARKAWKEIEREYESFFDGEGDGEGY